MTRAAAAIVVMALGSRVTCLRALRGDMKANLVDLTHSTLPWLCGSAPIPGLGKTMEEYRPQFLKTPSPSADGAADIS